MLLLSGCSTCNQMMGSEEAVDYKSTFAGDPLSIPPDLTQANSDAHYRAPEGTATFSQYAQNQQAQQGKSAADRILPQTEGISVMRDGALRCLAVKKRSYERRVGQDGVSTCRYRWSPCHSNKKKLKHNNHNYNTN